MLTVYSTQGSPGASTSAMHLAAHWASTGREVLLIEADPAGGSLSHNLGIQFTPGSASFVASGQPVASSHLIDHAQDVLFEKLHVMPAPASPAGAHGIFRIFADSAAQLRTISDNEIAVIIDGGRFTVETMTSGLTTAAAGVLVICRSDSLLSSLEPLKDVLAAGPDDVGPQGCAVTVGPSPLDDGEWRESYGLTFCGAIEHVAGMTADLSAHLNRNKRKSKKWRISLEQVGETLYAYAQPAASDSSREPSPEAQTPPAGTEPADGDGLEAPASTAPSPHPSATEDPAGYEQTPPTPEPQPDHTQPQPEPAYGQSQPQPEPAYGQSHYLPPTGWLDAPQGYGQPSPMPYAPEGHPAHSQPPPSPYQGHNQPPPTPYTPEGHRAHNQPPPTDYPGNHYQQPQPGAYPPTQQPTPPYEQRQPGPYPPTQQPTPPYEQPQPGPYPPTQRPTPPYEQPQPGPYPPTQQPAPSYGERAAQPQPPSRAPAYEQAPSAPADQTNPAAQQPETESPPAPEMEPTGSFRDWATKLHGSNADDTTARHRGV